MSSSSSRTKLTTSTFTSSSSSSSHSSVPLLAIRPLVVALSWILVVLAHLPTTAHAWGTEGHEIVANLAWRQLSPTARHWITHVLGPVNTTNSNGDNTPLGAVADWADRVRIYKHWSAALHYIDVRDDLIDGGCHANANASRSNPECTFQYHRDCVNDTCVAGAIVNFTTQLLEWRESSSSSSSSDSTLNSRSLRRGASSGDPHPHPHPYNSPTKEALMFLTHFIGDIHQPLHCSRTTDKGGNDFHVHFDLLKPKPTSNHHANETDDRDAAQAPIPLRRLPRPTGNGNGHHHSWNLHSVWDTGLIDVTLQRHYHNNRSALEDDLWQQLRTGLTWDVDGEPPPPPLLAPPLLPYDVTSCSSGASINCTTQWGQESWEMALRFAYTLDDNVTDVEGGSVIDEVYYDTRWPLVTQRLIAGSIRLASTLEGIVAHDHSYEIK